MVYTQAVLLEIMRLGSPGTAIDRCNAYEDAYLENTKLPQVTQKSIISPTAVTVSTVCFTYSIMTFKGTLFVINLFGIHRSDKIWEDPEVFRPERFLRDRKELVNADKIMPFGYGTMHHCSFNTLKLF